MRLYDDHLTLTRTPLVISISIVIFVVPELNFHEIAATDTFMVQKNNYEFIIVTKCILQKSDQI